MSQLTLLFLIWMLGYVISLFIITQTIDNIISEDKYIEGTSIGLSVIWPVYLPIHFILLLIGFKL